MVVTKQVKSLLINFWAFHKQHCKRAMLCFKSDHSGPQILCTYMANVNVTFCYTGSFIGNQTYAPMLNYVCVYVKYTSFKLCVYGYER